MDLNKRYSSFRKGKFYGVLKRMNTLRRVRQFVGSTYGTWLLSRFRLHGDKIHLSLLRKIIKEYNITSIVETGTFLGYTTELLAKEFPNLDIYTSEINPDFYKKAKKNLKNYKKIHIYNQTSPEFIKGLINEKKLGDRPFFYLDAHWLDDWPLEQELQIISKNIKSAVISIDDFKVEGDSRFIYDSYNGKECSLALVNPNLKAGNYNVLFPNYDSKKLFAGKILHPNLIGYAIILQNMAKEFELLKKSKIISNFVDKSYLIKPIAKKSSLKKK